MRGADNVLPKEENNKGNFRTQAIYNYGGGRAARAEPDHTRPCDVNIMETNASSQTIAVRLSPIPPTHTKTGQSGLGYLSQHFLQQQLNIYSTLTMTERIATGNTASWGGIDVSEMRGEDHEDVGDVIITESDLLTWSVASLMKAGADQRPAEVMARILLSADKRGHHSHGFNRLDIYHSDIVSGICQPNAKPVIEIETPGAALVDGKDGLGGVVAEFSMELAIKKAREVGVGWVTAKNSNHFGIAGEL